MAGSDIKFEVRIFKKLVPQKHSVIYYYQQLVEPEELSEEGRQALKILEQEYKRIYKLALSPRKRLAKKIKERRQKTQ